MPDWNIIKSIGSILWDLLKDYIIVIIVIIIIVAVIIINKKKKNKETIPVKDEKDILDVAEEVIEQKEIEVVEKKMEKDESEFKNVFEVEEYGAKVKKKDGLDIIEEMENVKLAIEKDSISVDESIRERFKALKIELAAVNKKKNEISEHGKELGKLFEKYKKKEYQIIELMQTMEKLMPKEKESKEVLKL